MKILLTLLAFCLLLNNLNAQTVAMQINRNDCNGNPVNLYSDLDSGKAVLLHFYMDGCNLCHEAAQKIQAMANHILESYPNKIKAYVFPYQNSIPCSSAIAWVSDNNLSLYAPLDSGAAQVAHYGGFGMPTVVLLAGAEEYSVLFSTQNFVTSDTTIMRDSILARFNPAGLQDLKRTNNRVRIFPNPSSGKLVIDMDQNESGRLKIELLSLQGQLVTEKFSDKIVNRAIEFNTSAYANGVYFLRLSSGNLIETHKLTISHN